MLILADVNPAVHQVLKKSGALAVLGEKNVFPATERILAAEEAAWQAAQEWLQQNPAQAKEGVQ